MDVPLDVIRKGQYLPIAVPTGKWQRVYFWFGEPIYTAQYHGDYENTEYAKELRDKVKEAVETGIKQLRERQASDPNRYLVDQYSRSMKESFTAAYETLRSKSSMSGKTVPLLENENDDDASSSSVISPKSKSE